MATATSQQNSASTIKGAAAGRSDLFKLMPDQLVIVKDKAHPLYDDRVTIPLPEWLIDSVIEHGILHNVLVRRNGHLFEVQDGRQRVRAAIEANKRLQKAGSDKLVLVPVVMRKDDDLTAAKVTVAANEHRQSDPPVVKARKAQHLLDLGATEGETARQFGVSVPALKNLLKVLDTSAEVQTMVNDGQVPLTAATRLADLPRDEQKAAMEEIRAAGMNVTRASASKKVAAKKEARRTGAPERAITLAPKRKLLAAVAAAFADDDRERSQQMYYLLTWVLTGEKATKINGPLDHDTLASFLKSMEA